ncbi:hypothetical protein BD289DRAFT_482490 [Coniella lustricola]|uniref:Uncharacterized protein n=1 Tax=Coniella lustricola TaxID=2025994 RepID=A0A2T3A8P2_9PEZI|nr:hypothetical protein BD289DRAFT_482490 [Coniella lustricola]
MRDKASHRSSVEELEGMTREMQSITPSSTPHLSVLTSKHKRPFGLLDLSGLESEYHNDDDDDDTDGDESGQKQVTDPVTHRDSPRHVGRSTAHEDILETIYEYAFSRERRDASKANFVISQDGFNRNVPERETSYNENGVLVAHKIQSLACNLHLANRALSKKFLRYIYSESSLQLNIDLKCTETEQGRAHFQRISDLFCNPNIQEFTRSLRLRIHLPSAYTLPTIPRYNVEFLEEIAMQIEKMHALGSMELFVIPMNGPLHYELAAATLPFMRSKLRGLWSLHLYGYGDHPNKFGIVDEKDKNLREPLERALGHYCYTGLLVEGSDSPVESEEPSAPGTDEHRLSIKSEASEKEKAQKAAQEKRKRAAAATRKALETDNPAGQPEDPEVVRLIQLDKKTGKDVQEPCSPSRSRNSVKERARRRAQKKRKKAALRKALKAATETDRIEGSGNTKSIEPQQTSQHATVSYIAGPSSPAQVKQLPTRHTTARWSSSTAINADEGTCAGYHDSFETLTPRFSVFNMDDLEGNFAHKSPSSAPVTRPAQCAFDVSATGAFYSNTVSDSRGLEHLAESEDDSEDDSYEKLKKMFPRGRRFTMPTMETCRPWSSSCPSSPKIAPLHIPLGKDVEHLSMEDPVKDSHNINSFGTMSNMITSPSSYDLAMKDASRVPCSVDAHTASNPLTEQRRVDSDKADQSDSKNNGQILKTRGERATGLANPEKARTQTQPKSQATLTASKSPSSSGVNKLSASDLEKIRLDKVQVLPFTNDCVVLRDYEADETFFIEKTPYLEGRLLQQERARSMAIKREEEQRRTKVKRQSKKAKQIAMRRSNVSTQSPLSKATLQTTGAVSVLGKHKADSKAKDTKIPDTARVDNNDDGNGPVKKRSLAILRKKESGEIGKDEAHETQWTNVGEDFVTTDQAQETNGVNKAFEFNLLTDEKSQQPKSMALELAKVLVNHNKKAPDAMDEESRNKIRQRILLDFMKEAYDENQDQLMDKSDEDDELHTGDIVVIEELQHGQGTGRAFAKFVKENSEGFTRD